MQDLAVHVPAGQYPPLDGALLPSFSPYHTTRTIVVSQSGYLNRGNVQALEYGATMLMEGGSSLYTRFVKRGNECLVPGGR